MHPLLKLLSVNDLILIDYILIGQRGWRFIEKDSIKYDFDQKSEILNVAAKYNSYDENDPMCCPTIKGSANYKLKLRLGKE